MEYCKKQHNINQNTKRIHGFTVPLRLLADEHDNYIVFVDCFIKTKCYLSFEDQGQLELFKACEHKKRTLFIARDVTYSVKFDWEEGKFLVSFIRIWKNRGRIDRAAGDPEFQYWIDTFTERFGER